MAGAPGIATYRDGDLAVIADGELDGDRLVPFKLHYLDAETAVRIGMRLVEIGRAISAAPEPGR